MRPHQLQPRSLLSAAPNDSAPYPVCHLAGLGHDCHGSLDELVCHRVVPVAILGGVRALNAPDILSPGLAHSQSRSAFSFANVRCLTAS